jgi:hypothetical protein
MKSKNIIIEWKSGPVEADLTTSHGELAALKIIKGSGSVAGNRIKSSEGMRLECGIGKANLGPGAFAARLTVSGKPHSFTVFVRDVRKESPVYIPDYGIVVTESDDLRSYPEIETAIRRKGLTGKQERIESEPEETYENACANTRKLMCPVWLGLGRDMRIFEVAYDPHLGYWGYIQPRYHNTLQNIPESGDKPYSIGFVAGPGSSCRYDITRRLEDGFLPILHSTQREEDIDYHLTAFCTLEKQPVADGTVRGSEWQACYPNTEGHMLSPEEQEKLKNLLAGEMRDREEETVCAVRIEAVNPTRTPQYAWFKGAFLQGTAAKTMQDDFKSGFSVLESGRVFAVQSLNGRPLPDREVAVLLQPGEHIIFQMLIPHQPLSRDRAVQLAELDFDAHLEAVRKFWRGKLAAGASIRVPENAVDERIKAGLLHCDIVTQGREPDSTVLAAIGRYSPIGSESAPIIQFFDSMGRHKLAERSLQFFLDRQQEDGFIQNFDGYQLETGPALWTMGEHYRYTRDDEWVKRIQPRLLKACDYLLKWRGRNKKTELRGNGYGLLDGKVADPQDFFHSFMLNGLSYLGIKRVSEMLLKINPEESRRLRQEAEEFREDIRTAFYEALGRSPLVPLDDGTWAPLAPPWTEYPGPVSLYAEGGNWFTHSTFSGRDSLIGSLYLVISEVLDAEESGAAFLLKSHQQLMTVRNAGLSQPYYCRHDYLHLKRGEVKTFLKTFYNQFTAIQDRETYTFWEHYYHVSPHKTHEEAWFLMQARWMLWLEEADSLKLCPAIPRRWLEKGKEISVSKAASYFGTLSFRATGSKDGKRIHAEVKCVPLPGQSLPDKIFFRLPHPEGKKALKVIGGKYESASETVRIDNFTGAAKLELHF